MVGVPVLYNRFRLKAQGPSSRGFLTPRSPVSIARALADRGAMDLLITEPIPWEDRTSLPERAGIYLISRGEIANLIYIGRTWGRKGIKNRIRTFHRSATTGKKGHAGGLTFHSKLCGDTEGLIIRTHLADDIDPNPEILHPYISYAERKLIWDFVRDHGRLPLCNSE